MEALHTGGKVGWDWIDLPDKICDPSVSDTVRRHPRAASCQEAREAGPVTAVSPGRGLGPGAGERGGHGAERLLRGRTLRPQPAGTSDVSTVDRSSGTCLPKGVVTCALALGCPLRRRWGPALARPELGRRRTR